MNPTNDPIEAALDAWSVPELARDLSARTLVRARATWSSEREPVQATTLLRGVVPALLAMAATAIVADTCVKVQRIFGA